MKAEIDNENKAKFFAQYWGQDVLCSDMYGDEGTIYSATMKDSSIKKEWLTLKPLSDISDEDAIEGARILGFINQPAYVCKMFITNHFVNQYSLDRKYNLSFNILHCIDYFRSRGYLVPWMGLSCEEILKAGWVKLRKDIVI